MGITIEPNLKEIVKHKNRMMNYLHLFSIIFLTTVFYSCDEDFPNKRGRNESRYWKEKPCKELSWRQNSCVTHGFLGHKYDTVIIETYMKDSKFDSLLKSYTVLQDEVSDKSRKKREFSFPIEITTNCDMRIYFSDSLIYEITKVKVGNRRVYQGAFCDVLGFEVNGESFGASNIHLEHPDYKY